MDTDDAIVARLGIDPTTLEPAPSLRMPSRASRERLGPPDSVPCVVCGAMAIATRRITANGEPRWLDTCRTHLLIACDRPATP